MSESQTSSHIHKSWLRYRAGAILVALALVLTGSGWLSQTELVPDAVDFVRGLPFVGPERMAALENVYYDAQDTWTQFIYDHTHSPVVISNVSETPLSAPALLITPTEPAAIPSAPLTTPTMPRATPNVLPETLTTPPVTPTPTLAVPALVPSAAGVAHLHPPSLLPPLILSDPQIGEGVWTTGNMPLSDQTNPSLWRTFYRPDPARPYARIDLVRIDLSQTRLTLVPGTVEPRPIDGIPGAGQIPLAVQSGGKLLAAWNGGFLTIHGAYGMMVNRRIILPPRDGFAVLAQYADGRVRLGVWGRDITAAADLVSFRENGPILIDHGLLNQDALLAWGKSISGETRIWRSGIGLTADGELIYGVGDALSAQTLGEALQRAGAVEAMQLDVNAWHVFFFTYALTSQGLVSTKLNAAIPGPLRMYLTPYTRDFMYLTLNH